MGIGGFQLPRLIGGWRSSSVREDLIWRIKAGEILDLSQNHGTHEVAYSGNGQDWGRDPIHDPFDLGFDL